MSSSTRNVIIQEIKAKFPEISWKLGSVVRELVVEPIAYLGDMLDSYIKSAEKHLDLESLYDNPAENEDAIDEWLGKLGISFSVGAPATGTIKLLLDSQVEMTILKGTTFYWGDNVAVVASESTSWGGVNKSYVNHNDVAFEAEIAVETVGNSGITLSSGASMNWDEAPSSVYDIYVGSAIVGGKTEYSASEKAAILKAALNNQAFCGEDCIAGALKRKFDYAVADAKIGPRSNSDPAVNLYIKSAAPPTQYTIPSVINNVNNTRQVKIDTTGIISVDELLDADGKTVQFSITYFGNTGDSDSYAVITPASGEYDSTVVVKVTGFPVYSDCLAWLNAHRQGTPFTFKLKMPAVAYISLFTGTEVSASQAAAISNYINNKELDGAISDAELLTISGLTVNKSITYSTNIQYNNQHKVIVSVGGANVKGSFATDGAAVAIYSYVDKVGV